MQNCKGNSRNLLKRNEKSKLTVTFRKSQTAPMCVFLSVITYGKLSPHTLHIPLLCQASPGLGVMNQKATANFHFLSIVAEFIMLLNANLLRVVCWRRPRKTRKKETKLQGKQSHLQEFLAIMWPMLWNHGKAQYCIISCSLIHQLSHKYLYAHRKRITYTEIHHIFPLAFLFWLMHS